MNRLPRRKSLWNQRKIRLAALLFAFLTISALIVRFAFGGYGSPLSRSQTPGWPVVTTTLMPLPEDEDSPPRSPRIIYPYSVIAGGVRSPEELREAAEHDPVVGEHYAGFDFAKARVTRVQQDRLVYLSYRIGDQVYWTTRRVSLHRGEKLITDGRIIARTRCGNRVSALPQKLASPQEPAAKQFDQPIGSSTQIAFPDNFRSALDERTGPGWGPFAPGLLANVAALPGGFLPLGSPLAPGYTRSPGAGSGGPGSGGPGSGPGPAPPGPGPPASAPESSTAEMIGAELLAIVAGWRIFAGKKD